MGAVAERIRDKLTTALQPERLEVVDDSGKHAGHSGARPGGETHFTVTVVSRVFEGLSRVERQRRVYSALETEIREDGVHALAISAHAPGEAGAGGGSLDPA